MTAPALRIVALLACMAATSVAQQPPSDTQVLAEATVSAPKERKRQRGPDVTIENPNHATVQLDKAITVTLRMGKDHAQVVFRRQSTARQLPEAGSDLSWINRPLRLELLPDRLIALQRPWIREVGFVLAAEIDEVDGLPAHIPFGPEVALVNLDYVSPRESQVKTGIILPHAMHPQTRQCESSLRIFDFWPEGTNQYILVGKSLQGCNRAVKGREGDLLFADNVPPELRQAVRDLHDPIASRLANRLGSEPGNIFVAWWPDSPRDGYRLEPSWNRNSLLLFHGAAWQQGIDAAQRESLRLSFMREQIQRRIRESDWTGPFTQAAVSYLLLLTRGEEDHTTRRLLSRELPAWIAGCSGRIQVREVRNLQEGVSSLECGLVLQFVYDAVARSLSAGRENIYSTWRRLLSASFRRGESGAKPADFLESTPEARRIAQGLVDGSVDWPEFAAVLGGVGVKLKAVSGGPLPVFEVQSLEHFED